MNKSKKSFLNIKMNETYLLAVLLMSLLIFMHEADGQSSQRRRSRQRPRPRPEGGLPLHIQEAYLSAVDNHDPTTASQSNAGASNDTDTGLQSAGNPDWDERSPSTPAPDDVDCYVEIVTIQLKGGRCTRLGGVLRPYICQSGQHFEFNPQCQQILEARNADITGP